MRPLLLSGLALLIPAMLLAGCGLSGPAPVTYTAYALTCCTQADVENVWQPGSTVELHWTVQTTTATGSANWSHKVVISATLVGPYADVTTLKQASSGAQTVQGSVITIDDRTPPDPGTITTFSLAPDLPRGYYNLVLRWDFGHGNSNEGDSVVRVGTP